MEVIAKSTFIRQTPRKLRLVADQIRGLEVQKAVAILENLNKQAAKALLLTLKQGMGNAINNFNLDQNSLRIKSLEIGQGPIYKRWRFVSHGRVHPIQKKTSHITFVLEGAEAEKKKTKEAPKKKDKKVKEVKKDGAKN